MIALVSVGSFAITIWATQISKKSLQHAIEAQTRSDEKDFESTRAELMNQISDCRSLLDKTRIEIGTARAYFDAEPVAVQNLLKSYTGLFNEYLPSVEHAIGQCDEDWNHVSLWNCGDRPDRPQIHHGLIAQT